MPIFFTFIFTIKREKGKTENLKQKNEAANNDPVRLGRRQNKERERERDKDEKRVKRSITRIKIHRARNENKTMKTEETGEEKISPFGIQSPPLD